MDQGVAIPRILAINPGSMSTKVAVFADADSLHESEVSHDVPKVETLEDRRAQVVHLSELIREMLADAGIGDIDAVVGRGGFLPRPKDKLAAGTYVVAERIKGRIFVDERMVSAVLERPEMHHASNLGIPVAATLAEEFGVPAYTVDPVVTDEFPPEAEISGYAPVRRVSTSHALSTRAAARRAAEQLGRPIEQTRFVVVHMGGGITVAAVRHGKLVDNSIALLGGGPFTPRRVGHLDVSAVMDLCYSGEFTREELAAELTKRAGLESYLGEHRMEVIEERVAGGDVQADRVVEAMVYQIAKEIGAMMVAAGNDLDAIVLTGGLARSKLVLSRLEARVGALAPFIVYPGSLEMVAMTCGTIAVLRGREQARRYLAPD